MSEVWNLLRVVDPTAVQSGQRGVVVCLQLTAEMHNQAREAVLPPSLHPTILEVVGLDPEPLGTADLQYTGTLNLAHTPNGLRLVQVEANHQVSRVERLTARLEAFDATAWGNPLLDPYRVVSSSVAIEDVTFPPIRFVCKPDELAFTGTEAVA